MRNLTDAELKHVRHAWAALNGLDPAKHTAVIAFQEGRALLSISTAEDNLRNVSSTLDLMRETPKHQNATEQFTQALAALQKPREPGLLRILWVGRRGPVVIDTSEPEPLSDDATTPAEPS